MPAFTWSPSSFSTSTSTSPSDSPHKEDNNSNKSSKRKLTRQRRLRYVTDGELGLSRPLNDRSQSLPVSPSRSPVNFSLSHWSTSAVPQPLPLPEFHSLLGHDQNDQQSAPNLRSPGGRRNVDGRDRPAEGNPSSSTTGSYYSHQPIRKATENTTTKSSSPTYRRRGFPQYLNVERVHQNFRLSLPARSAPTSGFSSPALSPQRFSTVNLLHSPNVVPQEFQVSSALEVSVSDRLAGSSSHVSSARITPSPDHSPLHGPTLRSPCQNTRSPTGVALHLHHKSLPESSMVWPEGNNSNVHPLPLPPGVSRPSQSTPVHHIIDKSDASSMKGQWAKGRLIGRGTYGSVYVATNRETGASCAMKEVDLIPDDPKSAECIKQLEQEIKVLQNLNHPNIVQYYGSEIVEDRFCIYLEYVHPGSINKYVREHCGAVTESVVRNFTRHIVSGLAYLHSTNTIHRDIKGANLLVNASGVVKLADFGLSKHLTGHVTDLSLKGSPHWMAPEILQAVLRKDANPEIAFAVDIWSLGCTVIEMLNGRPPWSEFNGVQAMFKVLHKSPPIPETLSLEGKNFLWNCFQRNPADRPPAFVLLEHPFLQNSHDRILCMQEFSGMKIDTSHNPREHNNHSKDLMAVLPGTWSRHGKLPCNGETCSQSYSDAADSGATCRLSPRSAPEVLPSISSSELNCISQKISPSYASSTLHPAAGSNHPHNFLRTRGREIKLL